MKALRILAGTFLFVAVLTLFWVKVTAAQSFKSGTNVTISQNEKVDQTVFAAGRTVDINAEVFGDVFCAGQTVNISGTVHGDVICAGQTVNVTGTVDGNVRLAGQTVTLGANVSGNATIGGQSFTLLSSGSVGGDLSLGSSDASLNGNVGRDLAVGGQNVTLASSVGRNIQGNVENLSLTSSAKVAGTLDYTSNNDASIASGAQVGGPVTRNIPQQEEKSTPSAAAFLGFGIAWFLYWFVAMLITAMALALLFPRALQATTQQAVPTPWKALLVGFVASMVVPVALIVLALTVVGLPLALLLGLLWFLVLILSGPVFGYYIGRLVLRNSQQPLLIMLVGASIVLALYFIPILGFFVLIAAGLFGTGMILLEASKRTPKPAYNLGSKK